MTTTNDNNSTDPIREIAISTIDAGVNHRKTLTAEETLRLAESIERNGLQQPIKVCQGGKCGHVLVWGARRLAAHEVLGRTEIRAIVAPPMTEAEIEVARSIENFDRLDLTPLEVARAVELTIGAKVAELEGSGEDTADEISPAAIAWAAEQFGRSPTWVRDHLFLMRLEGKARELTECGALPIRYAREIAKLADKREQEEIAEVCFKRDYTSGRGGIDLSRLDLAFKDVRRLVSEAMNSLKSVPWDQTVAFAGKPACETCPSNTAVARETGLFSSEADLEGGDSPDAGPSCLNPRCYSVKKGAVEKAIATALTRNGEKIKALPSITPVQLIKGKLVPKGVKPSTLASRARKSIDPAAKPTRKVARAPGAPEKKGPEPHWNAVEQWIKNNDKIEAELEAELLRLAAADERVVWRIAAAGVLRFSSDAVGKIWSPWSERDAERAVGSARKAEKAAQGSDVLAMVDMLARGSDEQVAETIRAAAAASIAGSETRTGAKRRRPKASGSVLPIPDEFMIAMPEVAAPVVGMILEAIGAEGRYRTIDSFLEPELKKAEPKPAKGDKAKPAGKKAAKKKAKRSPRKGAGS